MSSATKPAKTGATLPVACGVGEAFVLTTAPAGSNWYLCAATNAWALQGGGSGNANDGIPVAVSAANVLTIGSTCSVAQPCNVRMGGSVLQVTGVMQAIASSGNDTAYVYVTTDGAFTVGVNSAALTCSGGCVIATGITAFPPGALPLSRWTITSGAWQTGNDLQALLSADGVAVGAGLNTLTSGGVTTIGADPSVIGLRAAVPVTSGDTCVTGVWAADTSYYYLCVASNSWRRTALGTF